MVRRGTVDTPLDNALQRYSRTVNTSGNSIAAQRAISSQKPRPTRSEYAELCMQGINLTARGRDFRRNEFHRGMIINSALHEEDYNATKPAAPDRSGVSSNLTRDTCGNSVVRHEDITFSKFGPIHTKWRLMIVVAMFYDHYLAVPCYTHGDRGVEHKSNKGEYLPVSNVRTVNPEALITATWNAPHSIKPTTMAHVVRPVSRSYDLQCFHSGSLDKESTVRLIKRYNLLMGNVNDRWLRDQELRY